MARKVPLNPKMIRVGNNVRIASNVGFITHDITHLMLNNCKEFQSGYHFAENKGCIEIGDNVFIGAGTRILLNVRIGNYVVIGARSVVTKDVPDRSVVAGVPARVIGTFDAYVEKRMAKSSGVEEKTVRQYWQEFDDERS